LTTEARREFLTAIEKRYGRSLRRFLAKRMRHSAPDVPDLVQEVYLRLLRVREHDAIQNPQAYLYTVASHVLHQYAIRQSTAPELIDVPEEILDLDPDGDSDPAVALELEQKYEALGEALKRQSPNAYATLLMHRRDGVPLKEVAERLHVSYTMAKRYLATALAFLQQRLRESE
jgi:RNA polymerase sigma factor (sigma-70 family)